jgi:hypothetical protein
MKWKVLSPNVAIYDEYFTLFVAVLAILICQLLLEMKSKVMGSAKHTHPFYGQKMSK